MHTSNTYKLVVVISVAKYTCWLSPWVRNNILRAAKLRYEDLRQWYLTHDHCPGAHAMAPLATLFGQGEGRGKGSADNMQRKTAGSKQTGVLICHISLVQRGPMLTVPETSHCLVCRSCHTINPRPVHLPMSVSLTALQSSRLLCVYRDSTDTHYKES